jgi:hypothetical protein
VAQLWYRVARRWFGVGSVMVWRWFSDGSGVVQGWFGVGLRWLGGGSRCSVMV